MSNTPQFDTYKTAGLLSPLEADRMSQFSSILPVLHTLFEQQQENLPGLVSLSEDNTFDRFNRSANLSHTDNEALQKMLISKPVVDESRDLLDIFVKLFSNLHVEDNLLYLFELYVFLVEQSLPFRRAIRERIRAEPPVETPSQDTEDAALSGRTSSESAELYAAFVPHLDKRSLSTHAYKSLTLLFNYKLTVARHIPEEPLAQCISAISNAIMDQSPGDRLSSRSPHAVVVHSLMEILKYPPAREMFNDARAIPHLVSLIQPPYNDNQLVYEVCFCLWVLSFNKKAMQVYFQQENIIPKLHDVLRNIRKEKIVRIVLTTFRNLIENQKLVANMIRVSVPKTILSLKKRNFEDTDIAEILDNISEKIEDQIDELSSFDEYRQEVLSGNLRWSPVHTSEKFWKENLGKFHEDDNRMLRALAKIVDNASKESSQNLAIACHDMGMFVQYNPRGKKTIAKIGAKDKVIRLCEHNDQEVKKQALSTTQKLLLSSASWF